MNTVAFLRMISELKEAGLWDSLVSEAHSSESQPSPAVIEASRPAEEYTVTEQHSPSENTVAEELASLSFELGNDDLKTFNTLEHRKCFQLVLEFLGNEFEGIACFMICSIHTPQRDLEAIGHGRTKVRSDLAYCHHSMY